jgi:holo-[acyl-carrier protein] synthase
LDFRTVQVIFFTGKFSRYPAVSVPEAGNFWIYPDPRSPPLITGIGTDIVALAAFRDRLCPELIAELFLPDEESYCRTQARHWENFAVRFAAKEAAFKALGAGLQQGLRWHDVEVVRDPDGPVNLRLHGRAAALAAEQGVTTCHLSLSHSSEFAVATVVMENDAVKNPKTEA